MEDNMDPEEEEPEDSEGDPEDTAAGDTPPPADAEGAGAEGSATATPEDGQAAPEGAGGQTPAAPTGEDLLKMVAGNAEAQRILQQRYVDVLTQAKQQQLDKAAQAELQKLIDEERYDEIGRRFITEQQETAARSQAEEGALQQVYGNIYRQLFAHPVMQKLTAEDRVALDPQKFESDAQYVLALTTFIAGRAQEQTVEDKAQQRASAILEALKNAGTAAAATGNSVSALPGAVGAATGPQSSSELLRAGWDEMLNPEE